MLSYQVVEFTAGGLGVACSLMSCVHAQIILRGAIGRRWKVKLWTSTEGCANGTAGAKSGLQQREDFTVPAWSQPKFQDEIAQPVSSSPLHTLHMEMHIPSYLYMHFPGTFTQRDRQRQGSNFCNIGSKDARKLSKASHRKRGFSETQRVLQASTSAS